MARKRFVAPEFFTHRALYRAEKKSRLPLRVAFAGLWTCADRRGIFRWDPDALQLAVIPFDRCEMAEVLDALLSEDFIRKYTIDGRDYGIIPSFARWQHFHKNENPSKDPPPPKQDLNSVSAPSKHGVSTVSAPSQHPASTPVAVAVAITDTTAVTAVSIESEQANGVPVDGAERAGSGVPALSPRAIVGQVAGRIGKAGEKPKRLPPPPPPGAHAALVGT